MSTSSSTGSTLPSRNALRRAHRVCIKAGTSVVANADGRPSLTRLGAIIEQIGELVDSGVQVIFVSSGAVGMGKRLLRKQSRMLMSFKDINKDANGETLASVQRASSFVSLLDVDSRPHATAQTYDAACAAAGQFEMMNLYSSLFAQCDVAASQVLITQGDFVDESRRQNLVYTMERLLSLGVVPIINENDAVSANRGYTPDNVFSDNDSLAALCARNFGAEVLLLLTDVAGLYDRPPTEPSAKLLPLYVPNSTSAVEIGTKSTQGRGGMGAKIDAAMSAVKPGSSCSACVIAAGSDLNAIRAVLGPNKSGILYESIGTLFCTPGSDLEEQAIKDVETVTNKISSGKESSGCTSVSEEARLKATAARTQARKLQTMPYEVRQNILRTIAKSLLDRQDELLAKNDIDVEAAEKDGVALVLKKRLKLTSAKLATLALGLNQIADLPDPLHVVKTKRELAQGLELSEITVPIGVLLIIFESRPDSMPQIAALALCSANGLLLKGGKEATHSNKAIHQVIGDAIEEGSNGQISRDIIGLVTSRGQVADMLSLDDVIDLVIPRGSNALVAHIKNNTKIPVLGHADGVCHVYIDSSAPEQVATKIVLDSKTDYPSACNAMETLLFHQDTVANGLASKCLMALRSAGVKCLGGPRAMAMGLCESAAKAMKCEYGDLTCMVEVVATMDEAIDHIHAYGSGHTESIVCSAEKSTTVGEEFLQRVDAACVFRNASTRFADGYRFGLGAEVGISTGRIHARGPVGVEGLLTTKWQLRSESGDIVADFCGEEPIKQYTHKELP